MRRLKDAILVTTAANAADPGGGLTVGPPKVPLPPHYWVLEYIEDSGSVVKTGPFETAEACEAAIPKYEREEHGYNGHCVEHKSAPKKK
jgi:hypothetical protein